MRTTFRHQLEANSAASAAYVKMSKKLIELMLESLISRGEAGLGKGPMATKMRQPSDTDPITSPVFLWWRNALAGRDPVVTAEPMCGFFKRKLTKAGHNQYAPWVSVRIWIEAEIDEAGELIADEVMRCVVDGKNRDPGEEWLFVCTHPITEVEFDFLCAHADWVEEFAPHEPEANPSKPVSLNSIPLLF